MPTFNRVTAETITVLQNIVGDENVSIREHDRKSHSVDVSGHEPHISEVVVWASTPEHVAKTLKFASDANIAITPWGAGTSVEGNPIPVYGGILLSMARLNKIIALYPNDLQATVQAGVKFRELNEKLAPHGLFFACNTGGDATIGGLLANNAAGPKAVKYGAAKDNVLSLQVALTNGELITCGSRSIKQSSGYDLTHLFVGSEGTLGVITSATVKLVPIPQHICAIVANFSTVQSAINTVISIKHNGLDAGALEFMDADFARFLTHSESSGVSLEPYPTLFMEFYAGDADGLQACIRAVQSICVQNAAISFSSTTNDVERDKLWAARYAAYTYCQTVFADHHLLTTDTAVPISTYATLVQYIERDLKQRGLVGFMLGHAGDGNMHVILPYANDDEKRAVYAFNAALVEFSLELGGTATGEHGVGIGKREFMRLEHGLAFDVMYRLKQMFDPKGVLNPGKVF
jgi:D-lactate dehydrogenase (cytochrome)